MIEITINEKEFADVVEQIHGAYNQMPYSISRALNDAVDDTYNFIIEQTWPNAITQRNSQFIRYALHSKFSNKDDLRVEIYDNTTDQRAHLAMHDQGGLKKPRGANLAIPSSNVKRNPSGSIRGDRRPLHMPNMVRIGNKLYQRKKSGSKTKLVFMYTLKPSAQQPADVPFTQDFKDRMREAVMRHFPKRMMEAIGMIK